jgi:copper(I)-binding protein
MPIAVQGASFKKDLLSVSDGWVRAPIDEAVLVSLYFNIYNQSEQVDYLMSVQTNVGNKINIAKTVKINGINKSVFIEKVAIPPKTEVKFKPMGIYLVIGELNHKIKKGDRIKVKLSFAKAGLIELTATVV